MDDDAVNDSDGENNDGVDEAEIGGGECVRSGGDVNDSDNGESGGAGGAENVEGGGRIAGVLLVWVVEEGVMEGAG